ncbi:MAG: tRNA (adenosine(37)-N6)-threonylcarbamoyltransferase complex dimerization subunit type 1 TsaB [Ruminococcaceae bacterium]|nr:tRNA (adenosine(37)-N6)-threonylcarbamoyltransferase complex dimerization subunit type 1 TsaB [Oscillospiraceae bacterium]
MIILGVESSACAASAAILKDGKLICENYLNNGLTHSVTLLPMIKAALDFSGISTSQVDVFAVSAGPGSFTGLRIGAATIKGLASQGAGCLGVSTLLSMAYDHSDFDGVVCPCMDARCSQVYNALFSFENGEVKRLCEDRALMLDELICELKEIKSDVLLVGDGARLCYNMIKEKCPELLLTVSLAAENRLYQHAGGVCAAAEKMLQNGEKAVSADKLMLNYLRLPQAERELIKKENKK